MRTATYVKDSHVVRYIYASRIVRVKIHIYNLHNTNYNIMRKTCFELTAFDDITKILQHDIYSLETFSRVLKINTTFSTLKL